MTTLLRESAFWEEEEKTRAKKKGGSSPDARIKRRKKTRSINTRAPIKPRIRAKKCYSHPTNRSRVHVALRKTLNIRAARENFSPASFPTRNACTQHTKERERKNKRKKHAKNFQRKTTKDRPNATLFNLPHSPRRRRKTIYRRVSLLAWRVQPYLLLFVVMLLKCFCA